MKAWGVTVTDFSKKLRAENNWSVSDLAKKLHLSRQYIFRIEAGKYDSPPLGYVVSLSKILTRQRKDWLKMLYLEECAVHIDKEIP